MFEIREKVRNVNLKKLGFCLLGGLIVLGVLFFVGRLFIRFSESDEVDKQFTKYTLFTGYQRTFDDKHYAHLVGAKSNGIDPCERKADIDRVKDELVAIKTNSNYKIDRLTHSYAYLVPEAEELLDQIGENFRDALKKHNFPDRRIIVTSVLRTKETCAKLAGVNINASPNSTHLYGTTFDITYARFDGTAGKVSNTQLKSVLADVLLELRNDRDCFVLYEIRQACFHITVW